MADTELVTTAVAAKHVGIGSVTLWRWWRGGAVTPAFVTPGGQARWNVADLRQQLGIGGQPVTEPATKPEPQPVVAAIVVSEKGALVGQRNDGKPPWTFIAGEIEPGESPTDAITREVKEETGLLVKAANRPIGRRVHPKTGRTMIYLACKPTHGTDVWVGDTDELADVRWIASLSELDEKMPGMFEPVHSYLARALDS